MSSPISTMSRSPSIASGLAEIGKDPIVLDRGPFDRDLHPDPNLLGIAAGDIGVEARAGCAVEVDDDGDIDIILAGLRILVAHDIAEHGRGAGERSEEHTSELQSLMRI